MVNEMPQSSDKFPSADTFSLSPRADYSPWPITPGELASLVDLGLSDDQIARYFSVEKGKVSALRAHYGLAERLAESMYRPDLRRGLVPADDPASDG
jgi:hypothetical protein